MVKRILVAIAVVAPALALIFFILRPDADALVSLPLFHFYVVTFTTFSAAVISILLTVALGDAAKPRHVLAAAAFGVIGGLFFSHGLTTPQVIINHFHPAIQWSAWLTLFAGGAMFALASLDGPAGPPAWLPVRTAIYGGVAFVLVYSAIAALEPGWLQAINQPAAPWRLTVIFYSTLALWLFAAFRLFQTWRVTRNRVDGTLAFVAAWLAQATVSMHRFEVGALSWWLYHFILLCVFLFTAYVLAAEYERARQFRVIRYYLAASLILTALLALVASHLFAEFSYRTLVVELEVSSSHLVDAVTRNIAASLPEGLTASQARDEFVRRVSGEPMNDIRVYDENGAAVYPPGMTAPAGDAEWQAYFGDALTGNTEVRIREPGDAPAGYEPSGAVHLIETYTAIRRDPDDEPLGVLVTLQEAPELSDVVLQARATGLGVAGLTMGLLFAALTLVVGRADRIITTRANELRAAYTSLRQAESIRDDLTHMIIHDLRTPLSVMTASLDLLSRSKNGQPTESRARFVGTAQAAGRRMTGLIDDLLNVAKIEAGELKPSVQPTSMADLFADQLGDFSTQAAAEHRHFSVECPPDIVADVDSAQMGRVLANLVGNAFKYTEKGGAIQVSACDDQQQGRVFVSIRDNGEGIPDAYKALIFEKFVQVPGGDGRSVRKGTGLGLAFCRLVVEAHGGRIWIEDATGGGSEFKFWVPTRNTGNGHKA